MCLKELTIENEIIKNPSVSLSLTLTINEKVEYYVRIKTPKLIVLRFLVKNNINVLCDWTQVSLIFVLPEFINLVTSSSSVNSIKTNFA